MIAIEWGTEEMIDLLIATDGANINDRDDWGTPPIVMAVNRQARVELVRKLLDTGRVDVDAQGMGGCTALWWAAVSGHSELVRMLLATGQVNVNACDDEYECQTVLMVAAENGHVEVVELLLAVNGVDVDGTDDNGETALSLAIKEGKDEVAKALKAYIAPQSVK